MEIHYDRVCAYYGALLFADATRDAKLLARIEAAYAPCLSGTIQPKTGHVDYNVFGIVPFELFRQTGNPEYLPLARYLADEEFEDPLEDGLTRYTRFWLDDMYMVGSLQAQAFKALHEPKYADRGVNHLLAYVENLQQPNGLLRHTLLESPHFWARGNGWAAAGMTEVLLALPDDHPKREQLLAAYRTLMQTLVSHQHTSGMWHQLVDNPEAWLESSGTGMFVFALATGVRHGWLPADPHGDAARRAWLALTQYVDSEGRVDRISAGIVDPSAATYLNHPRYALGDFHGQAALLWAAAAMIRLGDPAPKHPGGTKAHNTRNDTE